MGGRIIAGVIGFVILVLLIQSYVINDDDGGADNLGRSGAAPTATLPAQTPEAISLGSSQSPGGGSTGAGGTTTGGGTYVVQSGDTLGSIATAMNVAEEAQAAWINEVLDLNGIADARLLQAGQELQLPEAPAGAATTPGANNGGGIAVATQTPSPSGGAGGTYIVESGDTPLGIAEKFCVEGAAAWVNELVALNGLDPNNLSVGQELELPPNTPAECQ
jgi:LysM repeat protein